MKEKIHPTYYVDATVICACGNTWQTGSTRKTIHTDVCSKCHPFYTGEQRIVDTEGQVDRFYKKIEARKQYLADAEARETSRTSLSRPVTELDLSPRVNETLAKAGIENVGQVLEKLVDGEQNSAQYRRLRPQIPGRSEESPAPVWLRAAGSCRRDRRLAVNSPVHRNPLQSLKGVFLIFDSHLKIVLGR